MAILKEVMSHWSDNGRKITSHRISKLRFSERSLDLIRGFQIVFDIIGEVWLPGVIIYLKIYHLKRRNVALAGQRQENDVTLKLQTRIFEKDFGSY